MIRVCLYSVIILFGTIAAWGQEPAPDVVPDFSGESFAALDEAELALLEEGAANVALLRQAYQSLKMTVLRQRYEFDEDRAERLAVTNDLTIFRNGQDLYRVDGSSVEPNGETSSGVFLINPDGGWALKLDPKTQKHFITRHGKQRLTANHNRFDEWWVDAALSFGIRRVDKELLRNVTHSRLKSVSETTGEDDERLVEIVRDVLPAASRPGDGQHDTPTETFVFFRDHNWVLKEVVAYNYVVGTPDQLRYTQRCRYEPFTDAVPRLVGVVHERSKRPLSDRDDDTAWRPYRREVVEVVDLSFEVPDEAEFRVDRFVSQLERVGSPPRARTTRWIFLVNGVLFILIWNFLRRRRQRLAAEPSGSPVDPE